MSSRKRGNILSSNFSLDKNGIITESSFDDTSMDFNNFTNFINYTYLLNVNT